MEADLFDLGICGDVLRVNVALRERDQAPENVSVSSVLRLKLTPFLGDGSFLVWVPQRWTLPKMQRASGTWVRSVPIWGFFTGKTQAGSSVSSFCC